MIKRILLAILIITFTSHSSELKAQQSGMLSDFQLASSDSLTIERADGQKIKLVWPYSKNIHKSIDWESLLDDFQTDFKKVSNDIPDYDYYHIHYSQKKNLVVNEVIGRQTYTVNEQNGIDYVKSNRCILKGEKIGIDIEFTDHEELLDPVIKQDIFNAIAQVKNKFYISAISPERHIFDTKSNKMLPSPKRQLKVFVPFGVQLGILQNQPYIELRPGLGLAIDKQSYIALQLDLLTQYNNQLDKTEVDTYIGISTGYLSHGFGSDLGLLVKKGITSSDDDRVIRTGLNYRTKGGLLLGAQYYIGGTKTGNENNNIDLSFSFGFGF